MTPVARLDQDDVLAIEKVQLNELLARLRQAGFRTEGPRPVAGALEYGAIETIDDLPHGLVSEQAPGSFRLQLSGRDRYFDTIPGADSWKKLLFPARTPLFETRQDNGRLELQFPDARPQKVALIGVRACELAAIQVQDRVFLESKAVETDYERRRIGAFIVAVDCHFPAATCFCPSMGTGPEAASGYDLALAELDTRFLLRVGSEAGAKLAAELESRDASPVQLEEAQNRLQAAREHFERELDTNGIRDLLLGNLTAARWDDVAARCLNCTSCTLVCPTCFCWDVQDLTQLDGNVTQRVRVWDSCFNPEHSYHAGGGSTRPDVRSRYRQWLTHKLASWWDQFGTSGCVGCGRCITWCPAGIDITEEARAIRAETSS